MCPALQCGWADTGNHLGRAILEFPRVLRNLSSSDAPWAFEDGGLRCSHQFWNGVFDSNIGGTAALRNWACCCTPCNDQDPPCPRLKWLGEDAWFPHAALLHLLVLIICWALPVQHSSQRLANHANRPWCFLRLLRQALDLVLDQLHCMSSSPHFFGPVHLGLVGGFARSYSGSWCGFCEGLFILDPAVQTRIWDLRHCLLGEEFIICADPNDAFSQLVCDGKPLGRSCSFGCILQAMAIRVVHAGGCAHELGFASAVASGRIDCQWFWCFRNCWTHGCMHCVWLLPDLCHCPGGDVFTHYALCIQVPQDVCFLPLSSQNSFFWICAFAEDGVEEVWLRVHQLPWLRRPDRPLQALHLCRQWCWKVCVACNSSSIRANLQWQSWQK